jgi:hypothetical protein
MVRRPGPGGARTEASTYEDERRPRRRPTRGSGAPPGPARAEVLPGDRPLRTRRRFRGSIKGSAARGVLRRKGSERGARVRSRSFGGRVSGQRSVGEPPVRVAAFESGGPAASRRSGGGGEQVGCVEAARHPQPRARRHQAARPCRRGPGCRMVPAQRQRCGREGGSSAPPRRWSAVPDGNGSPPSGWT